MIKYSLDMTPRFTYIFLNARNVPKAFMKRTILILIAAFLSSCGGGGSQITQGVTSPSVSLIGSYVLTGYSRDSVPQPGYSGDLEIGATQIYVNLPTTPPPWVNGTFGYVLRSSLQGDYIQAKQGNVEIYAVYFSTDNTLTLTTWRQMNNVVYETFWEKGSDSTTLN